MPKRRRPSSKPEASAPAAAAASDIAQAKTAAAAAAAEASATSASRAKRERKASAVDAGDAAEREAADEAAAASAASSSSSSAAAAAAADAAAAPAGASGLTEADLAKGGVSMTSFRGKGTERAPYRNKQRCLVLCTRGINSRYRHLMEDLRAMIPHHKKDSKLDIKDELRVVSEIAEINGCNGCVFLEGRKHRDLFLWIGRTPAGPSVKFHVVNVHTMDELRLTGNCLRGSRPLLSFDAAFEAEPHWQLMKELLTQTFGTPRGHPKSQPFHDHVYSFSVCDGRIWFRHYQILDHAKETKARTRMEARGEMPTELVEIGPRFVLNPVRAFEGAFGGRVIWSNPTFVTPNRLRHEVRYAHAERYSNRMDARRDHADRVEALREAQPKDELAGVFA
ncbi:hypothetical protein FNF29_02645 [Cafeteria roenbergensis]|uniref:Brix domain-containing protein n=1 Tax=Cafeteria roenbergensis TaxID=33653 RepID=A0A5A8CLT1_CAFRO|nr:hypothetical protein FNF29_02645 [Cafeteria roenbergensis]KAA0166758.1 hypothetical protein FNF31_01133 [Cafeteria roenbergensis]|eukprot:KAA0154022.1 hypothetical protein FNF29_02645 [Cafeteria roenbergensis]